MKRPAIKDEGKYVILKNKEIGKISKINFQTIDHKRLPVITVNVGNDVIREVYTIAGRCLNNPQHDMIVMLGKEVLPYLDQDMLA